MYSTKIADITDDLESTGLLSRTTAGEMKAFKVGTNTEMVAHTQRIEELSALVSSSRSGSYRMKNVVVLRLD